MNTHRIIFFGSSELSNIVLDELVAEGFSPELIVTTPDQPKGRKLTLSPSLTKVWAQEHSIPTVDPEKLKDVGFLNTIAERTPDLFIVASYGKIIPQVVLDIPKHGTLNVHPSLLPKLRGASPIQSAILTDSQKTGVTIMLMDDKMDHGPIVAQKEVMVSPWPLGAIALEEMLAQEGGKMLAKLLPDWLAGKISPTAQDDALATVCEKIEKTDAHINLADDPYKNYLKIKAFERWPVAYTTVERNGRSIRLVIKDALFADGVLTLTKVIPEGKREMTYSDFLKGNR